MTLSIKVAWVTSLGFIFGMSWLVSQVARPIVELPTPFMARGPRLPVAANVSGKPAAITGTINLLVGSIIIRPPVKVGASMHAQLRNRPFIFGLRDIARHSTKVEY